LHQADDLADPTSLSVLTATSSNPKLLGVSAAAGTTPGTYDVVITADGRATVLVNAVPVDSSASMVVISTNAAPFLLPPSTVRNISGTVTLNPASPTEETVSVAAKQTFSSGLTVPVPVTVKAQAADLMSGDYKLALPTDAPLFGQYLIGGTLPIPLVEQPAAAGQYTVDASAIGYQAQSFAKDISNADATQDFILTP